MFLSPLDRSLQREVSQRLPFLDVPPIVTLGILLPPPPSPVFADPIKQGLPPRSLHPSSVSGEAFPSEAPRSWPTRFHCALSTSWRIDGTRKVFACTQASKHSNRSKKTERRCVLPASPNCSPRVRWRSEASRRHHVHGRIISK
ncbi:hypothetical protein BC628DRAFT_494401 [Trametes gibbosa]|nr:hypothetical protein BC628DRAFT_494401 [Trametes gibbosa]